jgi:hypothetical protein
MLFKRLGALAAVRSLWFQFLSSSRRPPDGTDRANHRLVRGMRTRRRERDVFRQPPARHFYDFHSARVDHGALTVLSRLDSINSQFYENQTNE